VLQFQTKRGDLEEARISQADGRRGGEDRASRCPLSSSGVTLLTAFPPDLQERRDPRFSSLSGTVDAHLHAKSYGFLSNLVANEYVAGQEALKAAQKALRNAPRALREEREADVEHAERELARLRTKKELDERTRREREAMQTWKHEEKKKQAEGKGQWHMKDCACRPAPRREPVTSAARADRTIACFAPRTPAEKKRLLVEAKHAALLERGGQFAVKKALEKKRKKDAGKEKKARPRGLGFGSSGPKPSADGSAPARKRVKM
jgi:ribosomal RNA-processing protein 36